MSGEHQILVSAPARCLIALAALAGSALLAGCGQKGPLYLPTGEAAAGRLTLPETLAPRALVPAQPASAPAAPAAAPPPGTASPVRQP